VAQRGFTVEVKGYREFVRACKLAPPDIKKEMRAAFREVGEAVRTDARGEIADDLGSQRSARGLRTIVRERGVEVEQTLRKTTGLRPDWGKTQMRRALVPALEDNRDETEKLMNEALENVADLFELHARWVGQGLLRST
jgi:hypothetical protein